MPTVLAPDTVLDLKSPAGDWFEAVDDGGGLHIVAGTTSPRFGRERRTRRAEWRLRRILGVPELLRVWPVREVVTDLAGEVELDVGDAVRAAGGTEDDLAALAAGAGCALDAEHRPSLGAVVWASAYPLLRPALDAGATPRTIPSALEPLLRAERPREGVASLLGRTTRPLVRATARRLLPDEDGRLVVDPLVLAVMGAGTCGPEQLTAVIDRTPARPGSVAFSVGDIDRGRQLLRTVGHRRAAAVLERALSSPDGLVDLAERIAAWNPPRPPTPPRQPTGPRRPTPTGAAPAPTTSRPRREHPPTSPIDYPRRWRDAPGREVAGHRIVLPGTGDDLLAWGRSLDNCLGSFRYAAASGRSRIIGLVRQNRLRYGVEVTPGGTVRQFEGRGNRRPKEALARQIIRELRDLGLVQADGRTGRSLVAPG